MGVTSLEFRGDFWRQKTRVHGLSYGVVYVILGLAIFVELRLVTDRGTDREADRQTDRRTHDDSIYRASIARVVKRHRPNNIQFVQMIRFSWTRTRIRTKKYLQNESNCAHTFSYIVFICHIFNTILRWNWSWQIQRCKNTVPWTLTWVGIVAYYMIDVRLAAVRPDRTCPPWP